MADRKAQPESDPTRDAMDREHVPGTSADPAIAPRLEELKRLFPEVFSEGRVDLDKMRAALGEIVDDRPERYSFTWAGKRNALRMLQTPSSGTLIPDGEESVNFNETQNLYIEGENLEVLKLLYKSYAGRVKMIFIDPPYNTGQDFIYPDNFASPLDAYLKLTGQKDANGNLTTAKPEKTGRFHSSWLSMMYPRLFVARQLLSDDGVILVSIDDTEIHNLKMAMNEIFGEENLMAHIVWQKRYVSNMTAKNISDMHDHILVFARNLNAASVNKIERTEEQLKAYKNPDDDPRGDWRAQDLPASKPYKAGMFTIAGPTGGKFDPPPGRYWRCNEDQYNEWLADNRIWFGVEKTARPMLKSFLSEASGGVTSNTWWSHEFAGHNKEATLEVKELFGGASPFDTPKPVKLVRRMLETFADENALVLDFFSGSCTTAHAVLEHNHDYGSNIRFIMVQLPEKTAGDSVAHKAGYPTISAIGRERVRRAIRKIIGNGNGKLAFKDREQPEDLGFRAFRLDESHYRRWIGTEHQEAEELASQMMLFNDPLVPGWTPENVIYEVLLKEGYSLTSRVEKIDAACPNTIHRVTDDVRPQSFLICLDDKIDPATPAALGLSRDKLFICRDAALTDELAANLALQCRLKTI